MCDICVMNVVKDQMLSRRSFFTAGVAATAAVALSTGATTPAMAAGHGGVFDMTHMMDETFPTYFGEPGISYDQVFNFADNGFNLNVLTVNEHTGTHIDAPLHFSADGLSVDEIPVENLVCPLCVVDIAARAAEDADAQVTPDDLSTWIAANGEIPEGACVAMHSGWGPKVQTEAFRNADGEGVMHFPGFHIEATQMLLETGAGAIAVDTLSLDHGPSGDFATHYAWLPSNRFGIECLAGLDQMPASGATLVVGAPKTGRGTGGPARIFGMV
ncbi:cyclase family protein [Rhodophyticola sp. CCM32]|uniref:cyclase family protein n=1 Tax=Rhodophyticola sp. CCM32 TaxID=2916397 RepID=UPI00107FAD1C|nr:cyclase family protein [Rhodophyticola sp. CCM32]QBX99767.1 cyclase family protein [Rhodophyticola sp. CCM32]